MDWYEDYKKDLEETYHKIDKMWRSLQKSDIALLVFAIFVSLCLIVASVLYFCRGGWYIAFSVFYIILIVTESFVVVRTARRMRDTKEHIKANDMWYENELNRLNNLIKESENENENS